MAIIAMTREMAAEPLHEHALAVDHRCTDADTEDMRHIAEKIGRSPSSDQHVSLDRVLYGLNSLRCRKCRGLRYQSQYELSAIRLLDRARKLRRRLGTPPGASGEPLPPKPRYMRWRTYHRIELLVSQLEEAGWAAISGQVKVLERRLSRRFGR